MAESQANINVQMVGLTDLKRQFRELQSAMTEAGKAGDKELFNKLKTQSAAVKDKMGDLKKEMSALEPDAMIKNFAALGSAMVAAFSAGSAVASMFGADEKKLQQIQKNSLALIQLLQAAEIIRTTVIEKQTLKIVAAKMKEAAAWALANPIITITIALAAGLTVGIIALAGAFDKKTEAEKRTESAEKAAIKTTEKANDIYADKSATIQLSIGILKDLTSTTEQQRAALVELDKELGTSLSKETDLNKAKTEAYLLGELKLTQIQNEAKAEAAKSLYIESYKKQLKAQSSSIKDNVSFWNELWSVIQSGGKITEQALTNVSTGLEKQKEAVGDAKIEADSYFKIFITAEKNVTDSTKTFDDAFNKLGFKKKGGEIKEAAGLYDLLGVSIIKLTKQIKDNALAGKDVTQQIAELKILEAKKKVIDDLTTSTKAEKKEIIDLAAAEESEIQNAKKMAEARIKEANDTLAEINSAIELEYSTKKEYANKEFDLQKELIDNELANFETHKEILLASGMSEEEYTTQLNGILIKRNKLIVSNEEKTQNDIVKMREMTMQSSFDITRSFLDGMAILAGEDKKMQKDIAIFNLGLTLAQTYGNIAAAIAKAQLDPGFPLSIAETIRIAVIGFTQIPIIVKQVSEISKMKTGGLITDGSGPTSDDVPILGSHGEYMVNAKAVSKNYDLIDSINRGTTGNLAKEIAYHIGKSISSIPVVNVATETTNVSNRVRKIKNKARLR